MENIKLTLRPATAAERHFAYAVPPEEQKASGSIGYLRGDFGSSGESFYHTWFDISPELKTQAFKDEFDQVVNALRFDPAYGKLMSSRDASRKYGWDHPESAIEGNYTTEFAFRADTEAHAYILRLNPTKGDYNFSFHAFVREALEQQIQGREQKAHQELRDLPVYRYPASYAREHGESDQYRASRKACMQTPQRKT